MMGLFSFSGRTTRLGYLGVGALQLVLLVGVVIGVVVLIAGASRGGGSSLVGGGLAVLVGVMLTGWLGLAATTRRLRDMGWPVGYGMAALVAINLVGRLLISPLSHNLDSLPKSVSLFVLILGTCGSSFILTLWPSKRSNFDDIEDIFGGPDLDPETPHEPQMPSRPTPAPQAAFGGYAPMPVRRVDPSQPRATFGLRGA